MIVDTNNLISITEANQNFSKVARLVDEKGSVVILKNNVPRYMIVEFSLAEEEQMASDEDVMDISRRLIKKNRQAYQPVFPERSAALLYRPEKIPVISKI